MIIAQALSRAYPKFAAAVPMALQTAMLHRPIWSAFVTHSGMGAGAARNALKPGKNPVLNFRAMPGRNGEYDITDPNTVWIAKEICEKYETDPRAAADIRMDQLIQATIMHEICHWSDWLLDKEKSAHEVGKAFEKAAYGRDISPYWR